MDRVDEIADELRVLLAGRYPGLLEVYLAPLVERPSAPVPRPDEVVADAVVAPDPADAGEIAAADAGPVEAVEVG
jgi:hypothetical protein